MAAAAPAINGKETILVVDDEASIRRILETRLTMIGYHVVTAADGEEALDAFRREPPDLVVLDELGLALDYGLLDANAVISTLQTRPGRMDVILTGPAVPEPVMAMADQVTELRRDRC